MFIEKVDIHNSFLKNGSREFTSFNDYDPIKPIVDGKETETTLGGGFNWQICPNYQMCWDLNSHYFPVGGVYY